MTKLAWLILGGSLALVLSTATAPAQSNSNANIAPSADGAITGRVTSKGNALSNVEVKAWPQPAPQIPLTGGLAAITDYDGNYRFHAVSAGNYYVAAHGPGLVPAPTGSVSPRAVSVGAGETVQGVDFQLVTGGMISGRITDSEGRPVIAVPLILIEARPQPNPLGIHPNLAMLDFTSGIFRTDDRGMYRISGVPPGAFKVAAGMAFSAFNTFRRRPGRQQTFYPGVTDEAQGTVLEVAAESVLANIDFRVGPVLPTFSASGRLVDNETGQAIADASYELRIGGTKPNWSGSIPRAGSSDSKGEFRLENLPPGRYAVKISDARSHPAPETKGYFGESSWFEIGNSDVDGIELRALKTAGLAGAIVVENTSDKNVLSKLGQLQLVIETIPKSGPISFRTLRPGADGTFSIMGLIPGTLKIKLIAPEVAASAGLRYKRTELPGSIPGEKIEIVSGRQIEGLRVVLEFGSGSLRGEVTVANGQLPPGASLYAWVTREKVHCGGMNVDSRGHFLIEGIPAGDYILHVSAAIPGKDTLDAKAEQAVSVPNSGAAVVTITLDLATLRANP